MSEDDKEEKEIIKGMQKKKQNYKKDSSKNKHIESPHQHAEHINKYKRGNEEEEEEEEEDDEVEDVDKKESLHEKKNIKNYDEEEEYKMNKSRKNPEHKNSKNKTINQSNELIPHFMKHDEDTKRRYSLFENFEKKQKYFKTDYKLSFFDEKKEKIWALMDKYLPKDRNFIQESILKHIEFTLGKSRFEINNEYLYQGTSLSIRDRLLERWNDTQLFFSINNPKTIYYMSIEFLLGRLLQNALVCLDLEQDYKDALFDLGIKIEELYEEE